MAPTGPAATAITVSAASSRSRAAGGRRLEEQEFFDMTATS